MSAADPDPFAEGVRPTPWRSPIDEQKGFKLPPGFEIELVAAEPQIQKPMNLAFDERGRLWVTDTVEYPYPVPLDKPARDSVKVIDDTDGDGRPDRVTTFAEGLNIPIGVHPFKGGVIVWSIPNIWHLKDNDGDGKCDERVKLFGPLGYERDTHGMHNSFRRGFDGWIYACHGYNNQTTMRGTDGNEVSMQSGNSYRFRPDGSRVEQYTWGQVNPFGLCFDSLGHLFSADCHTRPITVLLRGGYYDSFGKPHDGLGFVPEVMQHLHGATANCGIVVCSSDHFPPEYRGNAFTGNVMTSRVNRDSLHFTGTTPKAIEEPDLVVTTDPWFRPVDMQEAPDGTLYIADFYNKIIGHYEVPLTHPGRDRTSGRIWRLVYRGDNAATKRPAKIQDLSKASASELIEALDHSVLATRMLAASQLVDRIGSAAVDPAMAALESRSARVRAHALWVLFRLNALPNESLLRAASDAESSVRGHALRTLAETAEWSKELDSVALKALNDTDAFVRRAAADAIGQHPSPSHVRPLLEALRNTPKEDGHLLHTVRMALRNQLRAPGAFVQAASELTSPDDQHVLAGIALAIPSSESGSFLLHHVRSGEVDDDLLSRSLKHAARFVSSEEIDGLAQLAEDRYAKDLDSQLTLLGAVQEGLEQRGGSPRKSVEAWGTRLAESLLASVRGASNDWRNTPIDGKKSADNPWALQSRPCADGVKDGQFLCTLPRGEQLTGVLRSRDFTLPKRLSFFLAGHSGFPGKPAHSLNAVRLRRAGTHEVLKESLPPRNDLAQRVDWDLGALDGSRGYLEVMDGDEGEAYAWLALGRLDPPVVALPGADPSLVASRQKASAAIAGKLKLKNLAPSLKTVLAADSAEPAACEAICQALLAIEPSPLSGALVPLVGSPATSSELRTKASAAIAGKDSAAARKVLEEAMKLAPARLQASIAQALAGEKAGGELLFELVKAGTASARLLQNRGVRERLAAAGIENSKDRIDELTAGLTSDAKAREDIIAARRKAFIEGKPAPDRGALVFEKSCATCHQVAGKGKVVGPQLDGIGNRGLDRVLEDVLDPNRNVDVGFRSTALVLKDGNVFSGLFRRREGKSVVYADSKGEEITFKDDDVAEESKGDLSLMPENMADVIPEKDFLDLIAFLLESRGKRE